MEAQHNLKAETEALLNVEKQIRLAGDVSGTKNNVTDILQLCFEARAWKTLNDQIAFLWKRRDQLKQTISWLAWYLGVVKAQHGWAALKKYPPERPEKNPSSSPWPSPLLKKSPRCLPFLFLCLCLPQQAILGSTASLVSKDGVSDHQHGLWHAHAADFPGVFSLVKKVEKQFMKMMVPQIIELVGVQVMVHKKEILIPIVKGGGTCGGSRGVGGTGEDNEGDGSTGDGYVSQVDPDMSWAQGDGNYYVTQDTDHGY
ncbi:26S proteasome non-ATPase regulatory subunit 12-like B [Vitis vinifera]|uniref:26S proteasome non-ATPase regulatory subunit 12-like B n=1 Tax=Vitis vinifera TaxID=29760 RepID=A0A438HHX2_VITVI|nr:26S proteasome non-ATPase regulatory subunit 12-like B [Vitis vinifera]